MTAAPRIGVHAQLVPDAAPYLKLALRYADAVLKAGGVPLVLPPVGGPGDVARMLDGLDGLLLTGGDDFDTQRLGLGPTHPAATPVPTAKQDWDLSLVAQALERGLPVLGICYGMQLLGLADGARLHQHLPADRPDAALHGGGGTPDVRHAVRVEAGSRLERLVGPAELEVVSRHHQALAHVPAPWRVSARDPEGLVEAVEREGHPFALGVQWHPELAPEGSRHDGLFRGLVGAAALASARRASALVP